MNTPTIVTYCSAWGMFEIPDDVRARAKRLTWRFGRENYLDDWCRRQFELARDGR